MPAQPPLVRLSSKTVRSWRAAIAILLAIQLTCLYFFHHHASVENSFTRHATKAASLALALPDNYGVIKNVTLGGTKIPSTRFAHLYNDSEPLSCTSDHCPIWREPSIIPEWMKTYFDWHAQTVPLVNNSTWPLHRFIVLSCRVSDDRCGGTADRLKPVPWILWYAYMHRRLLMIHWDRPCNLEEFLLPPKGGIDWRVPDFLLGQIRRHVAGNNKGIQRDLSNSDKVLVRIKFQSYNGGSVLYNEQVEGPSYMEVYHDVWRTMFTPSPPVARIIEQTMKDHNLQPGNYTAIHVRALYAINTRSESYIEKMATNALACASRLRPGGPYYFASDSVYATKFLNKWAKSNGKGRVESVIRDYDPVHLEMAENWSTRPVSDFYDTFVDLYLLGLSRCVAYGVGGFGHWGLMIGYNSSCGFRHWKKSNEIRCDWFEEELVNQERFEVQGPIFLDPIDGSVTQAIVATITSHKTEEFDDVSKNDVSEKKPFSNLPLTSKLNRN